MSVAITQTTVRSILTRTTGYLATVSSHSLQPYRGCTYGRSQCGVGCYAQHLAWIRRGRDWGAFLEVRANAVAAYTENWSRERQWARSRHGRFSIFMSSATDPFVPQERTYGITDGLIGAMTERPPDELVLQTHSHRVVDVMERLVSLGQRTAIRVHISIEGDRDRLPGLPPPPSTVDARLRAARALRDRGIRVVVTVAPLHPLADPERFFRTLAASADAVVLDHFVGGDGSKAGSRTRRTPLPAAMAAVDPASVEPGYLDAMVAVAARILPGRVGVGIDGFAGRFL